MNATRTSTRTSIRTPVRSADASLGAILLTAVLGIGILFAAGFTNSATLHEAAHDGRHVVSFPCH